MEETRGTVRLVEGAPFDVSTRGVTATLRRSDIEQAARAGDEPAELLLDVRRGQGADVEAHSVAVEWSQADLDRLLREAKTAEEVTIAFDGDEMAAAITAQADVEAHGLRDKVVVLTVVAVSALSTAGVAQAMPYAGSGGGAAATPAASVAAPAPAPAPATTIGGAGGGESIVAASPATTIGGAGPAPVEQVGVTPATTGATTAPAVPPPARPNLQYRHRFGSAVRQPGGRPGSVAVRRCRPARTRPCLARLASQLRPPDSPVLPAVGAAGPSGLHERQGAEPARRAPPNRPLWPRSSREASSAF